MISKKEEEKFKCEMENYKSIKSVGKLAELIWRDARNLLTKKQRTMLIATCLYISYQYKPYENRKIGKEVTEMGKCCGSKKSCKGGCKGGKKGK